MKSYLKATFARVLKPLLFRFIDKFVASSMRIVNPAKWKYIEVSILMQVQWFILATHLTKVEIKIQVTYLRKVRMLNCSTTYWPLSFEHLVIMQSLMMKWTMHLEIEISMKLDYSIIAKLTCNAYPTHTGMTIGGLLVWHLFAG